MGGRWQQSLVGIIMGVVAFVVIQELLEAFEIATGEDPTAGESLIATLVPIAVAVAVILFAFRGMGR